MTAPRGLLLTLSIVSGLSAIIVLALGARFFLVTQELLRIGQRAMADVVDVERKESKNGWVFHPVLSFRDRHDKTIKVHYPIGSRPSPYEKGDRISIIYKVDNPSEVRIDRFLDLWIAPILCAGLGAAGLIFSLVMFFISRRAKPG